MGFRDLECFNQALLAKQCWRLIRNPRLLVEQVLKACYFPIICFLEAKKGSNASFIWRSLIWGRELIERGPRWMIDSGNIMGEWKREFIEQLFGEDDAILVLSLPLGSFDHDDVLIWHHTWDGDYMVKSGYKFAIEKKGRVEASNPKPIHDWWNFIWLLKLPLKVISFAWKLCKDWLPYSISLSRHGMNVNTTCFRCGLGVEFIYFAIWGCIVVKDVWKIGRLNHVLDPGGESDMVGFLMKVSKLLDYKDFLLFINLVWHMCGLLEFVISMGRVILTRVS
ncbi:hypothetical protein UlMin_020705 [Ulmus minor]